MTIISPVFSEGKLVAFIGNIAHKPDLGGKVPGTYAGDPSYPARMRLQAYYQRQYDYQKTQKRWATAKELPPEKDMDFQPAPNAWRACLASVCIQQDAKVTPR